MCGLHTHTQGDRERAGEFELKQSKANRKSSPENCLWSISNRIQKMWKTRKDRARYKYGAAFVWACCYCMCVCVVIFSIFFVCSPFFHSRSRCTNHCSDCFDRNSKRRQTEKMYSGKNVQQNETTKDQCEQYSSSSYTVKNRLSFMRRMCDVCSWCSRVVSNAVVLVARTVSLSHSTVQCAVRHMQKGNPTERSFAAASAHQMF